jgi:tRNA pseudouridine13 synthase
LNLVEYRNNSCYFEDNKESELEKFVGIEIYSTFESRGIGGIYKNSYKDFIVQEITEYGNILGFGSDKDLSTTDNHSKYKYTTFNLVKVNRDTFDAVRLISKALKIPVDKIDYSGLKDKCSLSVQRISIPGNLVDRLKKLNIRDVFIRDIHLSKKQIRLGSNWGNKFIITLRNVEKEPKHKIYVKKILQKIKEFGFPNYYGLQRFGTFRPNSHLIGRYLLENKFEEAYNEFILNTYSTEAELSRNVRTELRNTGNLEKAFDEFPKSLNYEREILRYMIENPGDYEGAMYNLPSYLIKLILYSNQAMEM